MTAIPANPRVSELRDLFRHLADFRAVYEDTGLEEVRTPLGNLWSLWDLEYLLQVTERLTLRQRQVITLCLVHGVKESDAAEMMGLSRTNPVMMYASLGLQRLLDMIDCGELERFNRPQLQPANLVQLHVQAVNELATEVRSKVVVINGCWLYPNRAPRPPKLLVRSSYCSTGYTVVSPMHILWLDQVGSVPPGCHIRHSPRIPAMSISCSNPEHGELVQPLMRKLWVQTLAANYVASRRGAR